MGKLVVGLAWVWGRSRVFVGFGFVFGAGGGLYYKFVFG